MYTSNVLMTVRINPVIIQLGNLRGLVVCHKYHKYGLPGFRIIFALDFNGMTAAAAAAARAARVARTATTMS